MKALGDANVVLVGIPGAGKRIIPCLSRFIGAPDKKYGVMLFCG